MIMIGLMISQEPVVICPSQLSSRSPKGTLEPPEPSLATRRVVRIRTWNECENDLMMYHLKICIPTNSNILKTPWMDTKPLQSRPISALLSPGYNCCSLSLSPGTAVHCTAVLVTQHFTISLMPSENWDESLALLSGVHCIAYCIVWNISNLEYWTIHSMLATILQ